MSYDVVWADEALAAAHRYLADDREGLAQVFDETDLLAEDPRPSGAFARGVDRFRIHVGRYRVLYEVVDQTVTVQVLHLGRTG
ncbi:type II toxin-antitoxin system RelE family toxin [Nocardioides speluncae]|uniref:type II toxin-antitoxin system RelE family toxin n=1 Tax=Nocardioides speluncae TaxID=2670337 RepID=UPI000D69FCF2|nr:type II toxin-antitoxin system RelE/ParE family toxin [Nocardioides speluncae]